MHLNYYFLRQLSQALNRKLAGYTIETCFSQEKDELVIGLSNGAENFYLKAMLTNTFAALAFPAEFHRKRQNSVDLFPKMIGKTVEKVVQHENERSFYMQLSDGFILLFKLFGNRSNVVLFQEGEAVNRFHKKFPDDFVLDPFNMDRKLALDLTAFPVSLKALSRQLPTLGELPLAWLQENGFESLLAETQQKMVLEMLQKLENPQYFLVQYLGKIRLALLPLGEITETFTDPISAAHQFSIRFLSERFFSTNFNLAKQTLEKKRHAAEQALEMAESKQQTLKTEGNFSQTADIIMANLHLIPPRTESISLFDFYRNEPRLIKLKPTETPQKTAERLYKKAKNQQIELKILAEKALKKTEEILLLEEKLEQLESIRTARELKPFLKENNFKQDAQAAQTVSPFREFTCEGFKILVGKSAANNDVLTQKHTFKEDLWLHAKNVSGSHVVVKYQAGKTFPHTVIEKAAQLAAYYSKRKTDSLCPVIYTPKKYVRKPKGAAPGSVAVDRENVVLVTPENPFERSF